MNSLRSVRRGTLNGVATALSCAVLIACGGAAEDATSASFQVPDVVVSNDRLQIHSGVDRDFAWTQPIFTTSR